MFGRATITFGIGPHSSFICSAEIALLLRRIGDSLILPRDAMLARYMIRPVSVLPSVTSRHSAYAYVLAFRCPGSLSCTVSEKQRNYGRKLPILTGAACIWRQRWGDNAIRICQDLWRQKITVSESELSFGVVGVMTRLALLIDDRIVTDRRTDGQTDGRKNGQSQGHHIRR